MKYIVGIVIYVAVIMLGGWLFNIRPTFAEMVLVSVAASIAAVVEAL